jgi:hypothetical protein
MKRAALLTALALVMSTGVCWAQNTILDFTGFMYEEDNTPGAIGFPPSDAGDVLTAVGHIESISQPLMWSPDSYEYTIYISDLVSDGWYDIGGGCYYITYSGGACDIIAQEYAGAGYTAPDYGIEPPNATVPSTFIDGEVYLHGEFYSFYMVYYPTLHVGNFEGLINWTLHPDLGELFDPEGNIFAGTVDPLAAPVPDGFDMEMDGHVDFNPTIPVERDTWGDLKLLYR